MQKASIGKILLALVISCVYIYLFGIVQVVHVSADNEREIEVSIPEVTTSAETEKTPETTTIKLHDDKKPTLADVKAQTTATTKAETTTSTTTVKKRTPTPAADNTVIIPETTTVTTTAAATTAAPETTTAETTSAPTPTPDNSGEEQLSVYDQVTGTYYTAGAREIIARAVVGEIWNEFPDEAVKAQAVAEYTYIKKNNEMGVSPTTALKTDVYDRIYKLVDEVLGEAIYYNGEMIQCSFFASSCGYTNSAENVWGVD